MHSAMFISLIIEFILYHFGILDAERTDNFLFFRLTSVVTKLFFRIIFVSRNLSGFTSVVYLIFGWWLLSAWKRFSFQTLFISFVHDIINESLTKLWLDWFNSFFLCFSHVDIGKYYIEWSTHGASIYLFVKLWIQHENIFCC